MWFRRAAENGDTTAMQILSNFYTNGVGVDRDLDEAKKWKNRALAANAKVIASAFDDPEAGASLQLLGVGALIVGAILSSNKSAPNRLSDRVIQSHVDNLKAQGRWP